MIIPPAKEKWKVSVWSAFKCSHICKTLWKTVFWLHSSFIDGKLVSLGFRWSVRGIFVSLNGTESYLERFWEVPKKYIIKKQINVKSFRAKAPWSTAVFTEYLYLTTKAEIAHLVFEGRYKIVLLCVLTWEYGKQKHDSIFLLQCLHNEQIW